MTPITVKEAVGRYSQWAVGQLHPRSARSLMTRLDPLAEQVGSVTLRELTPAMLQSVVTGPHPERVRLAQTNFLEFCCAQGWITAVPTVPRTPGLVTPAEWQALMRAIPVSEFWYAARDRLVFSLLYTVGLPFDEIARLTRWTLTPSHVRYDGQWFALPDPVESAVLEWYACRAGYGANPVFITPTAQPDPLVVKTLNRHLKKYGEQAKLSRTLTVAKLRATGRVHGLLARRAMAQGLKPDEPSGTGAIGWPGSATLTGDAR